MGSVHKLLRLRKALSLSLSLPEQNPLGRSLFGDQDATPDGLPPAAAVGGGKGPLLLRLRLLGDQRAFSALFRLRNAGGQHPPVRKALQHHLSGSRLFRGRTLSVCRSLSVGKPGRHLAARVYAHRGLAMRAGAGMKALGGAHQPLGRDQGHGKKHVRHQGAKEPCQTGAGDDNVTHFEARDSLDFTDSAVDLGRS